MRNHHGLFASAATPANLDHRPHCCKTGTLGSSAQRSGQAIIVEVSRFAANVADQKNAIMAAARMAVGDVSVGTFHPPREIGAHEQIKNPINAVGGHPFAPARAHTFGNVIG